MSNQNVVGFEVSMQDIAFLDEFESDEQLLRVAAHGRNVQTHAATIFLDDLIDETKRAREQESETTS